MSFKITWKIRAMCLGISLILLALFNDMVRNITQGIFGAAIFPLASKYMWFFQIISVAAFVPIVTIIHELIHGAFYAFQKGRISFKYRGVYIKAVIKSNLKVTKTGYLFILLSPTILVSLSSMLLSSWFGSMLFLTNLLVSTSDFYIAFTLAKYGGKSSIIITKEGYSVFDSSINLQQ